MVWERCKLQIDFSGNWRLAPSDSLQAHNFTKLRWSWQLWLGRVCYTSLARIHSEPSLGSVYLKCGNQQKALGCYAKACVFQADEPVCSVLLFHAKIMFLQDVWLAYASLAEESEFAKAINTYLKYFEIAQEYDPCVTSNSSNKANLLQIGARLYSLILKWIEERQKTRVDKKYIAKTAIAWQERSPDWVNCVPEDCSLELGPPQATQNCILYLLDLFTKCKQYERVGSVDRLKPLTPAKMVELLVKWSHLCCINAATLSTKDTNSTE